MSDSELVAKLCEPLKAGDVVTIKVCPQPFPRHTWYLRAECNRKRWDGPVTGKTDRWYIADARSSKTGEKRAARLQKMIDQYRSRKGT